MSSNAHPPHQALEERRRKLDQRYAEVRARVVAAQQALDERARKLRDGLDQERQHLGVCRDELQKQAEKLLRLAKQRQPSELRGLAEEPDAVTGKQPTTPGSTDPGDGVENGSEEPSGGDNVLNLAKGVRAELGGPGSKQGKIHDKAKDLADLVRTGREEMDRAERYVESLRSNILHLRAVLDRTRDEHGVREKELEGRFLSLEKAKEELQREREELLSRIRELDTRDAEVQTHLIEAEGCRQAFEQEACRLTDVERRLESHQQDLRRGVEQERRRLHAHQMEIRRRAAELTRATREQRCAIEAEIGQLQAELDLREAELRARRAVIEEAGHQELERTNSELEDVLSVGLHQIEKEMQARQRELDIHDEDASEPLGTATYAPSRGAAPLDQPPATAGGTSRGMEQLRTSSVPGGRAEAARGEERFSVDGTGQLEALLNEVAALQEALTARPARCASNGSSIARDAVAIPDHGSQIGTDRCPTGMMSSLRNRMAQLRGAPRTAATLRSEDAKASQRGESPENHAEEAHASAP